MEPIQQLRIIEITNDTSKVEQSLLMTSEVWRETLTRDQHISREKALEQRLLSLGMPMHHWSLEVLDKATNEWQIVSCMDAIERPALVKAQGKRPLPTTNYVIDAVYTPEEHRGKGYAATMIEQVIAHIQSSHSEKTGKQPPLVTLWSDVGDYYTRFGFQRAENARIIDSPSAQYDPKRFKELNPDADQVTLLDREQSQMAIDYHRAMMVGAIDVMTENDGNIRAIVSPTKGILEQMQWRSEFVSQYLGVANPKVNGARTENGWAAWSYMLTEKTLYVLAISGPIHEMVSLYAAALQAAKDAGDFKVILYEADLVYPDRRLAQHFFNQLNSSGIEYTINEPDHSIPYFLGPSGQATTWEFPGRYSWY